MVWGIELALSLLVNPENPLPSKLKVPSWCSLASGIISIKKIEGSRWYLNARVHRNQSCMFLLTRFAMNALSSRNWFERNSDLYCLAIVAKIDERHAEDLLEIIRDISMLPKLETEVQYLFCNNVSDCSQLWSPRFMVSGPWRWLSTRGGWWHLSRLVVSFLGNCYIKWLTPWCGPNAYLSYFILSVFRALLPAFIESGCMLPSLGAFPFMRTLGITSTSSLRKWLRILWWHMKTIYHIWMLFLSLSILRNTFASDALFLNTMLSRQV